MLWSDGKGEGTRRGPVTPGGCLGQVGPCWCSVQTVSGHGMLGLLLLELQGDTQLYPQQLDGI